MKSPLRATALLGGSSAVSIAAAVAAAKAWALLLGPGGYGVLALWQALARVLGLVAGLGIGVALVRLGAESARAGDHVAMAHLRRATWLTTAAAATLTFALMLAFRRPLAAWALGSSAAAGQMPWVALAVVGVVVYGAQAGILNVHHEVAALAKVTALGSCLGAATGVAIVAIWRAEGIPAAILAAAAANCLVCEPYRRAKAPRATPPWSWREIRRQAASLLRFGFPYTAANVVGTGAQYAMPFVVLWRLGVAPVGLYRAAAAIAVAYLALVLTAMGQDYFPRLSAARNDPAAMVQLMNEQHRVILLLGLPLILGALALAPIVIPILYSRAFAPAVMVLEWILVGDILKIASWVMSFAILARCPSRVFLGTEFAAGALLLTTGWLGMRAFGLEGAGIAFPVSYAAYYLICYFAIRRSVPLAWTPENRRILGLGLGAVLLVRFAPMALGASWRAPLAGCLAVVAAVAAWRALGLGKNAAGLARAAFR